VLAVAATNAPYEFNEDKITFYYLGGPEGKSRKLTSR